MSVVGFKKATKVASKARIALCGPPGSGKTYTSLEIAQYLAPNGNYLVIDTERGSASKYASDFPFEYYVEEPSTFAPRSLIPILDRARESGIDVCIIDSLSHYWMGTDGMLDQVSKIARRKNLQSEFPAWKDVNPDEKAMWDAFLGAPFHIIATLRTKTEYVMEEVVGRDGRTRMVPRKVGLAPMQRAGLEYEFDIVADLDVEQNFVVTKSRCKALNEYVTRHAGREFALKYRAWLEGGAPEQEAQRRVHPQPEPEHEHEPKPKPESIELAEKRRLFNELIALHGSVEAARATVDALKQSCVDVDINRAIREHLALARDEYSGEMAKQNRKAAWVKSAPVEDDDALAVEL